MPQVVQSDRRQLGPVGQLLESAGDRAGVEHPAVLLGEYVRRLSVLRTFVEPACRIRMRGSARMTPAGSRRGRDPSLVPSTLMATVHNGDCPRREVTRNARGAASQLDTQVARGKQDRRAITADQFVRRRSTRARSWSSVAGFHSRTVVSNPPVARTCRRRMTTQGGFRRAQEARRCAFRQAPLDRPRRPGRSAEVRHADLDLGR